MAKRISVQASKMIGQSFFHQSQDVFQRLRLWTPREDENKTFFAHFLKILVLLLVPIGFVIVSISDTTEEIRHGDSAVVITSVMYMLIIIAAAHKIFSAALNASKIRDCIRQMEGLSKRFKNTSNVDKSLNLYKKLFTAASRVLWIAICLFMIAPLTTSDDKRFGVTPHLPFLNVTKSPNWQLFFVYEFFSIFMLSYNMLAYDSLFCGMLCVCSGIVSSICQDIREFDEIIEDHPLLEIKMKETIRNISEVTQLTEHVSEIFSMTTLSHMAYNSIGLAMGLFVLLVLPIGPVFLLFLVATFVELIQLWIFCYFGQNVVSVREELQMELYFTRWYDASKNFKTMLLLAIIESQIDRYVYAGKLLPLSLKSFTEVVKRAYTFFTFLRETR